MKLGIKLLFLTLLFLPAVQPVTYAAVYEWTTVNTPIQNAPGALEDVYMMDRYDGWAVGLSGKILHWNGAFWESVPSPVGYDLFSVYMIDSNNGWAVGAGGAIIHWNGSEWVVVPEPLAEGYYRSVHMISSDEGWAVGSEWIEIEPSHCEQRPRIIYYGPTPPAPPPPNVIAQPRAVVSILLMLSALASYLFIRKTRQ
ncbi:hypothetical protein DRO69_07695 [Candidatus Bathyarchaeota archaeon]|nr:MAG: hypothetical protein DRO69_07695 [Candidatus Bathyarchaeota archaeon]